MYDNIVHITKILSVLWSSLECSLNNNGNFTSASDKAELSQINFYEAYF